jgi:nicotinamidase-related amidase
VLNAYGRSIPTTLDEVLGEPCALVVWDMQEGIARRATNVETLLETIPRLTDAARRHHHHVIYSQHFSPPLEYEDRAWIRSLWESSGRGDPAALRPAYPPGSPGWQFVPETAPHSDDVVIPKTRPNFFIGTPFRSVLAARGIDTVLMTGVATERGVLTTVRDAAYQGVMMVVVTDAVGTFSDAAHERGLQDLGRLAHLCTTDEVISTWDKASTSRFS